MASNGYSKSKRSWIARPGSSYILLVALGFSLILNICQTAWHKQHAHLPDTERSRYSGLAFDTLTTYRADTDYWADNQTLSDTLWESLSADPVAVALSREEVSKYKLPPSIPFLWDDEKGLYYIKAFHHLHCLKVIYRAVTDYERGNPQEVSIRHVGHCLDALRQDIMCKADDTPMPIYNAPHSTGDGQVMECRNWGKLVAWTQVPERNACYKIINDYKTIKNPIERHAFCPPNSPYYDFVEAYFEKFGHKPPFDE